MASRARHNFDLAIIGAGFAGSMVAVHVAQLAPRRRVLVLDKDAMFGPGVAFGARGSNHLLNVRAGKMSAFPEAPDHFVKWIEAHPEALSGFEATGLSAEAFLPRRVYGQYIRELLDHARQKAPGIECAREEIVDLEPSAEKLLLTAASGRRFTVSKAVLALGNFPPGDPPAKDRAFHSSSRYLSAPWSEDTLERIRQTQDILLLGSGLTTLDLLVSLEEYSGQGRIHVVSRHGLFPQPHQPHVPHPDWFRDHEFPNTIRSLLRYLRKQVDKAAAEG